MPPHTPTPPTPHTPPPSSAAAGTSAATSATPEDSTTDDSQTAAQAKPDTPTKSAKKSTVKPADIAPSVEAALIGSDRAVPPARLSEILDQCGVKVVREAVDLLNRSYEKTKRSFRIEEVAGGYQIMTLSDFSGVVGALNKAKSSTKLGPAAMETLAIIAYKQPILRADVEVIRGVACGEGIRALMEKRLVKIVGRAEELGRPMLYGTTKSFLEIFGLSSLKDLPKIDDLVPPSLDQNKTTKAAQADKPDKTDQPDSTAANKRSKTNKKADEKPAANDTSESNESEASEKSSEPEPAPAMENANS